MSTELVAALRPLDLIRETSAGADYNVVLTDFKGDLRGVKLPKYKLSGAGLYGYTCLAVLPANLTYGTGLTLKFYLTNSETQDVGKKVYVGVTVKKLAADETTDID